MGGRQHMELAYAVAAAVGLTDPTILVEASALPDIDRTGFPGRHHDARNAEKVAMWLYQARCADLNKRPSDRDYYLGYALHFLADAYSPYTGQDMERDLHDAFEATCGRVIRRGAYAGVEPPVIPAEQTGRWIGDRITRGYAQSDPGSSDYVRVWSTEVYKMSVCAARAVIGVPAIHPQDERSAGCIYAEAQRHLEAVRDLWRALSELSDSLRERIARQQYEVPRMFDGALLVVASAVMWVVMSAAWLGPATALAWNGVSTLAFGQFIFGLLWLTAPVITDILTEGAERPGAWLGALPSPRAWSLAQRALAPVRRELRRTQSELKACLAEAHAIREHYRQQMRSTVPPRPWYSTPPDLSHALTL